MNTPITYYGGKIRMLPYILPKIPNHRIYVEPFAGGAAVFFAKKPSQIEALNDINGNIANFYRTMINDFDLLNRMIETTLHDEYSHKQAKKIFNGQIETDNITKAWAVWVLSQMSFGSDFQSGWQWVKNKTDNWHPAIRIRNKREDFKFLLNRLKTVSIHNTDAIEVITKRDSKETFQYIDPPYVGARQGHYNGYTQNDFKNLIDILPGLKSNFLLSSYKNDLLYKTAKKYKWTIEEIEQRSNVSGKNFRKVEVLTYNYKIPQFRVVQKTIYDNLNQ